MQIPCLNEGASVGKVIKKIKKILPKSRIIVYDNGSDDDSIIVSKKNGAEVRHVTKRGKGNVVRQMFSESIEASFFVMVDGDDTYDVTGLKEIIKKMDKYNYDMMVGKRIHNDRLAYRKGHVIGNKFFSKFANFFFGNDITDIFSGFRIFSKRFVKTFPLISQEFEIEAELTIHSLEQKLSVSEFDCIYSARIEGSYSKLNTFKDGAKIIKLILILIKDEKPLFFFSIISSLFLILSLFIGIPAIKEFYTTGLVPKFHPLYLQGVL